MIEPYVLGAALSTALAVSLLFDLLLPKKPKLRDRLRPYVPGAGLGPGMVVHPRPHSLRELIATAGRILEGSSDAALSRKLHQAGVLADIPSVERPAVYRSRVVVTTAAGCALALVIASALRRSIPVSLGFAALGGLAGSAWWRGRLDRAVERRRALIRIELYTVDQLLAMHIRAGAGVVSAVRRLAARGRGEVVAELREVLRLHRSGIPAASAFRRVAAMTPEPHARRTYQALAAAEERGSDVARALLALSEDVREGRRDAIRRRATRRRALMLVPILGLLAPVLVLFIAAPLPWLVLHGFG